MSKNKHDLYIPQLIVYAVAAYDHADATGDRMVADAAESTLSWCIANLRQRTANIPDEMLVNVGLVVAQFPEPFAVSITGRRLRVEAA